MSYKTCGESGGEGQTTGRPCGKPAGWGTGHVGEGRCRDHEQEPEQTREDFKVIQGEFQSGEEYRFAIPRFIPKHAVDTWKSLVERLEARGLLDDLDEEALGHLVTSHGIAQAAAARLLNDGILEEDAAHGGRQRKHPAFQIWRDALSKFDAFAQKFGMTPSDREDLEIEEPDEEIDRMEEILSR